jgi:hypothetical protein
MEKENCIEKPGNTEPEVLDFYRTLSKLLSREHLENNAELVLSLESKICIPTSLLFTEQTKISSYKMFLSLMNSFPYCLLNKSKSLVNPLLNTQDIEILISQTLLTRAELNFELKKMKSEGLIFTLRELTSDCFLLHLTNTSNSQIVRTFISQLKTHASLQNAQFVYQYSPSSHQLTTHQTSTPINHSQVHSSHSLQNKPLLYSHQQIIRVFCEAKHILIPNQLRNVKDFEVKRLIQPNLFLECVKQQISDSRFQNSKEEGNVNPRIRKLFLYFNQNQNQDSNSS